MSVDDKDATGEPRPTGDILAALTCITAEIVRNPMAMSKGGEPLVMHYLVIKDALVEVLALRTRLAGKGP